MTTTKDLRLFSKEKSYLPRVGAVHDLCGYGNCSLGVAIPVLSAAGCDVCPVPTSLFSAHTLYPDFYMHDTTSMIDGYLDSWEKCNVSLDAVYSGFLGSAEQVDAIKRLYATYSSALRVVDPVMGDGGKRYPTYSDEMCEATKGLVPGADVLTPNLTEASILTDIDYVGQDASDEYVKKIIDALLEQGAKTVVLKGISRGDGLIRNFVAANSGEISEHAAEELPFMLHGTGDLFASSLLAALLAERTLGESVDFAGHIVHDAMLATKEQPDYKMRGVSFEGVLWQVTDLVRPA